jgi:hypothetical protein
MWWRLILSEKTFTKGVFPGQNSISNIISSKCRKMQSPNEELDEFNTAIESPYYNSMSIFRDELLSIVRVSDRYDISIT